MWRLSWAGHWPLSKASSASQEKLWVPQSPGKAEEEVILQWGLELIKDMAFTEGDTERKKQIPAKTVVGDREEKLCAKDRERRKNINCLENAVLKDV